jgi:hypothetical protein
MAEYFSLAGLITLWVKHTACEKLGTIHALALTDGIAS